MIFNDERLNASLKIGTKVRMLALLFNLVLECLVSVNKAIKIQDTQTGKG